MLVDGENALAESSEERVIVRRVQRIGGGASTTWQRIAIVGIGGMVVFAVGLFLCFAVRPAKESSLWSLVAFGVLWLFALSGFLLIFGGVMFRLQQRRELRRGYTPNAYTNVNAAQIDLRTGIVIREPGEPLMTKAQRVDAVRRARAWGSGGER